MLKSYLITAIRNIWRNKLYSGINLVGLSMGVATAILLLLYLFNEYSFDKFQSKADRIYRVVADFKTPTNTTDHYAALAYPQAKFLQNDFKKEIEAVTRLFRYYSQSYLRLNQQSDNVIFERIIFTEASIVDIFDFKPIVGDLKASLQDTNAIALDRSTAMKLFGTVQIVGKTVNWNDRKDFIVKAVFEDYPEQSHFTPRILGALDYMMQGELNGLGQSWWGIGFYTYILVKPQTDIAQLEKSIYRFHEKYIKQEEELSNYKQYFFLQPLTSIYLQSNRTPELKGNSGVKYLYGIAAVGFFILLLASINYVNLATARSMQRAREVGIRKLVGSNKAQLVLQFYLESSLLVLLAFVLALLIIENALSTFNWLIDKQLELSQLLQPEMLILLVSTFVLVTLMAGLYPAFFIAGFQPVSVLKGRFIRGAKGTAIRKALVVFQFSISIVLVVCTLIINSQTTFMRKKDLGFEQDRILLLYPGNLADTTELDKQEALRTALVQHPMVEQVSFSLGVPGRGFANSVFQRLDPKTKDTLWNDMSYVNADENYASIYQLKFIAGHNFTPSMRKNRNYSFILNEAAVAKFGWKSPQEAIGQVIWLDPSHKGEIIGVFKNYHFQSLKFPIRPLVITLESWGKGFISVLVKKGTDPRVAGKALKQVWDKFQIKRPYEFHNVSYGLNNQYAEEDRLVRLINTLSILAIFIAFLGLFGLASFTVAQRTKEIGIRKVLGASLGQVLSLIARDFMRLVIVACIVALPIAYTLMQEWLQNFAYRIVLIQHWYIFLIGLLLAMLVAMAAVSFHAIRAARLNPVDVLKDE